MQIPFSRRSSLLAAAILVGGVAFVLLSVPPGEPSYSGRKLSDWAEDVPYPPIPPFEDERASNAVHAIQQIGTNALPLLLRKMQTRDSHWRSLCVWLDRKQSIAQLSVKPAEVVRSDGALGILALGPAAEPVLPELARILHVPDCAREAAAILPFFGQPGYVALSAGLTNSDARVRMTSAVNLWKLEARKPANATNEAVIKYRREAVVVLPRLLAALQDTDDEFVFRVITVLQCIGNKEAVPALRKFLVDTQHRAHGFRKARPAAERTIHSFTTNIAVSASALAP